MSYMFAIVEDSDVTSCFWASTNSCVPQSVTKYFSQVHFLLSLYLETLAGTPVLSSHQIACKSAGHNKNLQFWITLMYCCICLRNKTIIEMFKSLLQTNKKEIKGTLNTYYVWSRSWVNFLLKLIFGNKEHSN